MKTNFTFIELTKNEDSNYDGYFKVVFSGTLKLSDELFQFRYTEEEGMGIKIEINLNGEYVEVRRDDKFEYLFIDELFSQSPIDFEDVNIGEEIEINFDYDEEDGIIEF